MLVIQAHLALLRMQQGQQQAHQCGLACSCFAQDGRTGAGRKVERQMVDNLAFRVYVLFIFGLAIIVIILFFLILFFLIIIFLILFFFLIIYPIVIIMIAYVVEAYATWCL